jgi:hypothetical protein
LLAFRKIPILETERKAQISVEAAGIPKRESKSENANEEHEQNQTNKQTRNKTQQRKAIGE